MYLKTKFLLLLVIGFLAACAGNPDLNNANEGSASQAKAVSGTNLNPKDQEICKYRQITGSRFKQKTCMTAAEWENMSYETRKMLDKNTRNKVRNDP
ncbi:hypothetical protein [Microbulbifer sediminum]|uniref:hypothetical protein n=1 Tax=Microbulbifer sediminum TaxID=2904250 RepID=UPI001F25A218|nr:hypothetical protein [Microbulbifer sediminum]